MAKNLDALAPSAQLTQQNAIYRGLTSILTAEQANAALKTWSTYFNDTGSVFNGLNSFARDVCKHYNKDDQQRELVRALNRALINKNNGVLEKSTITQNTVTKETVSQNIESINNKIANTSSVKELAANDSLTNEILADESTIEINEQVISTPDFQTFQCVFLKLIRLIEENRKGINEALHAFLNELTESMPWSEAQQEQIFALMATGNTIQIRTYRPDQLKSFMKHLRSWMEGEMGTANTKRILNQAVKEVELLPVGIKFSPKNFM